MITRRLTALCSSPGGLVGDRPTKSCAGTRLGVCAVLILTVAAGCGSSSKSSSALTTNTIDAGQVNIQLPAGWKVTKGGAIRPASVAVSPAGASGASGASGATGAPGDTIPLAKQDPQTKFFSSLSTFSSCLKGFGVKFIGIPDASNPKSPTNDKNYIDALSKCAAKSNILAALKDYGTFQDNLTPDQIKIQNKGYLAWRKCMIGRGWGIPEPKPDSKGRLFSFSTSGGGSSGASAATAFKPPPGEDIVTSSDVQECASEASKAVPEATTTTGG
jgi:hypothetical protein